MSFPRLARLSSTVNAGLIALLFTIAALYNGPGKAFHLFAVFISTLAIWIAVLIIRPSTTSAQISTGWLPATTFCYLVWLFVSPTLSSFPYVSQLQAIEFSVLPMVLFAWWLIPRAERLALWPAVWTLLLIVGSLLALWGMSDFVVYHERAHNPFVDPNAFAALLNLFLIPLSFKYLTTERVSPPFRRSGVHLALIALFGTAQFMTWSRAGLLTAAFFLVIALVMAYRTPGFARRAPRLVTVLAVCYAGVAFGPVQVGQRDIGGMFIGPGEYLKQQASFQTRLHIWQATWDMAKDTNPLVGAGLGTFKILYPAYRRVEDNNSGGNYAHNDYLQALQEGGIIQLSFLSFFTLGLPLWLLARKKHNVETTGLLLAVMCISLHAFLNFIHYVTAIVFVTGLFLARASTDIWGSNINVWRFLPHRLRPAVVKTAVVFLLVLLSLGPIVDGVIFAAYARPRFIGDLSPDQLVPLTNLFIAVRPNNPLPREVLIRALIASADRTESGNNRNQFIERAVLEGESLLRAAPAVPVTMLLLGKAYMARAGQSDEARARFLFEEAVKRAPHSAENRLELLRFYRSTHSEDNALAIANGIRPWLFLVPEEDRAAMSALAEQAVQLATSRGAVLDARYWRGLQAFLEQQSVRIRPLDNAL